jgi:hypothetical protein
MWVPLTSRKICLCCAATTPVIQPQPMITPLCFPPSLLAKIPRISSCGMPVSVISVNRQSNGPAPLWKGPSLLEITWIRFPGELLYGHLRDSGKRIASGGVPQNQSVLPNKYDSAGSNHFYNSRI